MNITYSRKRLEFVRKCLMVLNFAAVIYNTSLFLFCTKYILASQRAHSLLENLSAVPSSPIRMYLGSMSLFALLMIIMIGKGVIANRESRLYSYLTFAELVLAIWMLFIMYDCYSGIILFVFMDIFYTASDNKYWLGYVAIGFGMQLIANYQLVSIVLKMPSLDVYIAFLPQNIRLFLLFIRYFIDSLNIVLFIAFLVIYLLNSLEEKQHIEEELAMASQVNAELKNYVALTEKIAEDRERKRIAREIHDTLGHALTGIAAGVDAVLVLFDIDHERAKHQLQLVSQVVREGIGDVRRSLNKLRPGALEERTLKDALNKMIEEYKNLSKLDIELYYEWDRVDLEITKEDVIFRVIQESITNSLRHGHARKIEIQMFNTDDLYYITIQDDGIGCAEIQDGFGLTQMKERLAIIGGKVSFYNMNGFRTMVEIPKMKGEDKDD